MHLLAVRSLVGIVVEANLQVLAMVNNEAVHVPAVIGTC